MATGAPFSIARIGSTSPLPMLTLIALTTICWIVALFDGENTRSTAMFASAKKPFLVPIWIGHRFADAELTPPAITVSAARAAGATRSAIATSSALVQRAEIQRTAVMGGHF
jgi:hypothetical protein